MDTWKHLFEEEGKKSYWTELWSTIDTQQQQGVKIFPPRDKIFRAFELCPFDDLKVVVLGQDPYHDEGQADGLAFSVPNGKRIPPSLRNIYQELGKIPNLNGDLSNWAKQGVLLLNSTLTVRESNANSHEKIGWKLFTDAAIKYISENKNGIKFVLWGANAFKKRDLIDTNKHEILESSHPSPFSARKYCQGKRPFLGSNVFSKIKEIDWFEDTPYRAI